MKEDLFKIYIKKVIDYIDKLEPDNSLLYLDDILKDIEIKDILNGGKSLEKTYKYLNKNLNFINKYKYGFYIEEIDEQDIIEGARSLITVKYYISKGINKRNIKELIKGILIFSYFKIPFNQLIEIEDLETEYIKLLSVKLEEILSALSIKVSISKDAPYNEKRDYEEYEDGIKEKNMRKVYGFVEAVRRGTGYGLRRVLRDLIRFTFFINPILVKEVISKKTDPLEILIMIEPLEDNEKLIMGSGEGIKNGWVFVAIIYQILANIRKKRLEDKALDLLRLIVEQLQATNEGLFFQCINYFRNYEDFNIVLGRVLGVTDKEIILKYVNNYIVTEFRGDSLNDQLFIENFINESEEELILFLCSAMFKKWEKYLEDLTNQHKYIQEPIYTNCFYIVIYYFLFRKNTEEDFVHELEMILLDIQDVNYNWCENQLKIRAKFFMKLTYFYLLSIECRHKSYTSAINEKLFLELEMFFKDKRLWLYYFDTLDKPSLIKEIEKNFILIIND